MVNIVSKDIKSFTVKAPATSANMGPGYDCAGIALELYSYFHFERSEDPAVRAGELEAAEVDKPVYEVSGCPDKYCNEDNLCIQSFKTALKHFGEREFGIKLRIEADVPVSRGLGSSSTCIVAGVLAAYVFTGRAFDELECLGILNEIEGHPDNVAPCLLGGMIVTVSDEQGLCPVRFEVSDSFRFVVIIPDYEVSTHEARKAVVKDIDISKAVYSVGHAVTFFKGLCDGDAELCGRVCSDVLHEPYRRELIPDYEGVRELALKNGACAFCISGSGSTMLAVIKSAKGSCEVNGLTEALRTAYPKFRVEELGVCRGGAEIITEYN